MRSFWGEQISLYTGYTIAKFTHNYGWQIFC